ncbi:MAG: hypothetical protein ACD_11C00018G0019 [uncultured bacterium]|nr:MAG: hypothetical protein ACD_11C00018G0019 [uncultured bacterium]
MKKILFTLYKNKCHSLYKQFISVPPSGYQYFTLDDFTDEFIFSESENIFVEIFNKIKRNFVIINIAKKNNIDIIYCTSGMLLFNSPIPWVIEFESVVSFIIHKLEYWKIARKILPIMLRQDNLKSLIPWTEAAARSLLSNIKESKEISNKITPIHLCLAKIGDQKKKENDKIFKILFVTTVNDNAVDKQFYVKGGRILIEILKKLKDEVNIKFIIRSKLPKEYEYVKHYSNVVIYEDLLPKNDFDKIFSEADIFLFPCYQSPGLVFLDAMSFGLPILTTNIFANAEMVIDGYNGFLVDFPIASSVNYLDKELGIKNLQTGRKAGNDNISNEMVDIFCKKILLLYNDIDLKNEMSKKSRELLESKFTIEKRNEKLKKIFDNIVL